MNNDNDSEINPIFKNLFSDDYSDLDWTKVADLLANSSTNDVSRTTSMTNEPIWKTSQRSQIRIRNPKRLEQRFTHDGMEYRIEWNESYTKQMESIPELYGWEWFVMSIDRYKRLHGDTPIGSMVVYANPTGEDTIRIIRKNYKTGRQRIDMMGKIVIKNLDLMTNVITEIPNI